ncbi:SURF1 family protein [Nocardioides sp. HDW12B]|uniref:SURF1 family protein n=1 Tax=Nocardioides sp. HDW12B TaxID=2714939 RepID=UPI00140C0BAF|nr:SURF1 family protein [Nocardioides sp. HDW12B]QIK67909.1 SURF1 family protein [Nocardioides sp. HDW12B]
MNAGWREWLTARMLVLHTGLVLAVLATTWLGFWQVGAWQGHREDRVEALADAEPVPLASVIGPDDAFPTDDAGRPVTLSGRWLPEDTVEVTGRLQHGDLGRWVVVPFAVCEAEPCAADASVVPVVLGWSEDPAPDLSPPTGTASLVARLQPAEQDDSTDTDPDDAVLPSLRIPDFVPRLEQDLYSAFVILDEPAAVRGSLEPVTPSALPSPPASTGLRNLLYGVQWWIFGCFAVVVWWRWSRDELATARAQTGEEPRIASEV